MRQLRVLIEVAAAIFALAITASGLWAHPITVDGSSSDWTFTPPTNLNTAHYGRGPTETGEFLWSDAQGDERTDLGSPDIRVDLRTFGVTADCTGVYFLVNFQGAGPARGDGAVMAQIAIDLDQVAGSGQTWMAALADTTVAPAAAWEFLVRTSFGSGRSAVLFDQAFTPVATLPTAYVGSVLEIAVPWQALGLPAGPSHPLRFSVATFRSTADDVTWDLPGTSNALDAVTDYGDPGTLANTWAEVSDGVLNDYVDVWFHLDSACEPLGPALISECAYYTNVTGQEWVELVNISTATLDISGWRLGDEETVNGTEGTARFPLGATIAAAGSIVVANTSSDFFSLYGFKPDYEINETDAAVPNLTPETLWSTGVLALGNSGDEVLLLDGTFSVVDVLTWGIGTYPGVTSHPGAVRGYSLERAPVVRRDRNDCSADFIAQASPTPRSVSDVDNDGYAAGPDCDDTNPRIHPGAVEVCNGLDDDCSAVTPDGSGEAWYEEPCDGPDSDLCEEGLSECAGGAPICTDTTGDAVEVCDDLDNDCDGTRDEGLPLHPYFGDADGDGYGDSGSPIQSCHEVPPPGSAIQGGDCNDGNPGVHPGAQESCNGVDDDCSPGTADGTGEPWYQRPCDGPDSDLCQEGLYGCAGGAQSCSDTTGDTQEICDGLDNDCDSAIDEENPGGGADCQTGLPGVCASGTETCIGGGIVCVPDAIPTPETCDGLDNDCDGPVDEGNPGGGADCDTGYLGVCAYGTRVCVGGGIVCSPNAIPSPETCDGLDNDCDGPVDEGSGGPLCDDSNPCTDDVCTGASGCLYQFNAAPCDDGNACTAGDSCAMGACAGAPVGPPAEVGNQGFTSKVLQRWDPASGGGPSAVYDVVRGLAGEWPVGTGAAELCRAQGMTGTLLSVPEAPPAGAAFWFLVRARTICGTGSYGMATGPGPTPTPRVTTACP